MTSKKSIYIGTSVVVLVSLLTSWLLPVSDILKGIYSSPAILGLITILYQLARDQASFEKEQELQQQSSTLSAALVSGMGEHIFQQQVLFAEKYMESTYEITLILFQRSMASNVDQLDKLFKTLKGLRSKHALWLSNDMLDKLIPFEEIIWQLIVGIEEIRDEGTEGKRKMELRKELREKLNTAIGYSKTGENLSNDEVLDILRGILGVDKLLKVRESALFGA